MARRKRSVKTKRPDFRERLIDAVKARGCVWDLAHPNYNNQIFCNDAWEEVGEIVGMSAVQVKHKFKGLRDTYRRKRKEMLMNKARGIRLDIQWRPYPFLTFLDPYMCIDVASSFGDENAITVDNNDDDDDTPSYTYTYVEPEAEPTDQVPSDPPDPENDPGVDPEVPESQQEPENQHEVIMAYLDEFSERFMENQDVPGHFGRYIAESLRKMTTEKSSRAKYLIQQVIYEVENDIAENADRAKKRTFEDDDMGTGGKKRILEDDDGVWNVKKDRTVGVKTYTKKTCSDDNNVLMVGGMKNQDLGVAMDVGSKRKFADDSKKTCRDDNRILTVGGMKGQNVGVAMYVGSKRKFADDSGATVVVGKTGKNFSPVGIDVGTKRGLHNDVITSEISENVRKVVEHGQRDVRRTLESNISVLPEKD